jgi:hypothetical protein
MNPPLTHSKALNWPDNPPSLISTVNQTDKSPPCILVGRVISLRPTSKSTVTFNIETAWHFLSSVSIEETDVKNTFLFTFENHQDMIRVLELSPWNIRGHPLILKYWDPGMTLSELDFSCGEYWIQVHELPLELMTSQNAEILGGQLGTLLEIEAFRREFLRIKVLIPLHQPLVSGFLQERQGKSPTWVKLKYERLSEFCFNCGRLGHIKRFCPSGSTPISPHPHIPFGLELRAKTPPLKTPSKLYPNRKIPILK